MGYGSWVRRRIPLDLDGVTSVGWDGLYARRDLVAVDITGDIGTP